MRQLLIMIMLLISQITLSQTCDTTFKTFNNVNNSAFNSNICKVRYVTHRDNYPKTGQQTWYYEVYSGTPSVSHTSFGFPSCLTIKQMGKYVTYDSSTFTKYNNVSYGFDPSTSTYGYKFDRSITENTTAKYYITVDKVYETSNITITIKASNKYDTKSFCGPDMNCEALPITILSYNIIESKDDDILIWYTATEIDIEFYEVTLIGEDTTIIDRILVDGNSTSIRTYRNVYSKPDMSNYYYRIDAVNYDRNIDKSFFLSPKKKKSDILNIYPNPSSNYIELPNNLIGKKLSIYDMGGKLIIDMVIKNKNLELNISPGVYFIYCDDLRNKLIIF